MKWLAFLLSLVWMPLAWAECVTIDTSAWEQGQKNLLTALSYQLIYASGTNEVPQVNGSQVCVQNPAIDLKSVLSASALEAAYTAHMQQNQQAEQASAQEKAQQAANREAARQKLGLTVDELKALQAAD